MSPGMSDSQNKNATEVFRNEFDGYRKMAASDYLEHSLLFGTVEDFLKKQGKPLRILDLGCGDAANFSKVLANLSGNVKSYTGVDMSESALQTAQKLVQQSLGNEIPTAFHISDMLTFLKQTLASYDVITAAFALHHLTPEDKKETLKEVRRLLTEENGVFLMVDPFRRETENLAQYRDRAASVGETWVNMGTEQQRNFIQHMKDYDIVETEAFFQEAVKEAGFSEMDVLCRGKKGLQSNVTVFRV